jgi:hypothetical protein
MVKYEWTIEYDKNGVGTGRMAPETEVTYRNGIGERVPKVERELTYRNGVGSWEPVDSHDSGRDKK